MLDAEITDALWARFSIARSDISLSISALGTALANTLDDAGFDVRPGLPTGVRVREFADRGSPGFDGGAARLLGEGLVRLVELRNRVEHDAWSLVISPTGGDLVNGRGEQWLTTSTVSSFETLASIAADVADWLEQMALRAWMTKMLDGVPDARANDALALRIAERVEPVMGSAGPGWNWIQIAVADQFG